VNGGKGREEKRRERAEEKDLEWMSDVGAQLRHRGVQQEEV